MKLSKMTLGTVQLGLNYGINNKEGKPSLEKAFDILDMAILNNITTLDTAAGYGDSEKVIGQYFYKNNQAKNNCNIVTKFKLGNIQRSEVEKNIYQSIEQSLLNLGVNNVETLLMHDAKEYEQYQKEIDKTYEKLLNEKLINNAGASGYTFEEINDMLANELYSSYQLPVNMLDQRITAHKDKKKKLQNKTLYVRSVYLQGIFFKEPNKLTGNLKEIKPYLDKVNSFADKENMSVAELALRYVNSLNYVNSLVIGCDNITQVKENITLLNKTPFSNDKMKEIEELLSGVPEWIFFPMLWDKQG
ncbi:MAG: aldo/keto reductase [Clostridiales bacterium]|nr:aldo/keto reductase [Clostridiales bacterium]